MEKKINYLARDFQSIKEELINFSKKYYPEISDNFNDASVGAWFIDLLSAVGDDLSYHTDRMYQETNINSATLKSSILNVARINGVKIPGVKSSICEVELSILLPIDSSDISSPNWDYAPLIKRGSIVGNTTYEFEISEDVNFAEQFNNDGVSNRTFIPIRNSNGIIESYKVTKTVVVYSGKSRIYKKVLSETEVVPFMEIILPEQNVCNVESIIFKETANFDEDPEMYEFFIDEEEFWIKGENIPTYRYFEVDSLADQYRFGCVSNVINNDSRNAVIDINNPQVYEDYTEGDSGTSSTRSSRYFAGKWKPLTQKFMTEFTDNNFLKIIFGGATDILENNLQCSQYYQYISSKIINNNMLGLLPKAGWTMYILYRMGGGISANLGVGSINKIINVKYDFPLSREMTSLDAQMQSSVIKSLNVTNKVTCVAGKDAPSVEEIKYLTKYSVGAQKRCVTLKDYKAMLMQIPPKYGCPFRCNIAEDNNKISIAVLGINNKGKLTSTLPKVLADNLVEYLSHFKSLTDYVEIRSGKVFHLGFNIDVFIDKNYVTADVVTSIINMVNSYMDINKHDMGTDIFIGDMEREINGIDGVISLIDLRVYGISGGDYSPTPCPLPVKEIGEGCNILPSPSFEVSNGAQAFEIDLDAIDHVLYNDYDSMFEIKNPLTDIRIRTKLR